MTPTQQLALVGDEGKRLKPYTDSRGFLSIGIGRNLTADGIRDDECSLMFRNDVTAASHDALTLFAKIEYIPDPVRAGVIEQLVFNMGLSKVLGFVNMLAALKAKNYDEAADQLLNSRWANEVQPERSQRLAEQLRMGRE